MTSVPHLVDPQVTIKNCACGPGDKLRWPRIVLYFIQLTASLLPSSGSKFFFLADYQLYLYTF